MGFNLRILLYLSSILATMAILTWCLYNTSYYASILVLLILLALQIAALLKHLHATNRELKRFLEAVKYGDFSQNFRIPVSSSSFRELGIAFNDVMERFRAARSDKEQQAAYLQALIQHLPVAILAIDDAQHIVLCNTELLRMLERNSAPDRVSALGDFDPGLRDTIVKIRPGRERTLRISKADNTLNVKLSCTILRYPGHQQKLVSIQNIESELEVRELEAWQNLIRVMTHEIMNSVTPITSLAETAETYVEESLEHLQHSNDRLSQDTIQPLLEDAGNAVSTIGKRGQGLMRFVSSYRTLSRLPKPQPQPVQVQDAFRSIAALQAEQCRLAGLQLDLQCKPRTLQLLIDPEQFEQALINLLRNALDAVAGISKPSVKLSCILEEGGVIAITVSDNGCGISQANLDNIFVPFFTTKRGGSGIGMSMVKQIIRANGGRIAVNSEPGQGTSIRLIFRQY